MSQIEPSEGGEADLAASRLACHVRRRVLELSFNARAGHIGSCLSIADILAALFASPEFNWHRELSSHDRFVLAKGHAGLALYCVLEGIGIIDSELLDTFGSDGSHFGVHPEQHTYGIDFATGSLGQGLGFAVGAALAARIKRSEQRAVTLLSDAECNSGSTWEAASFGGHHRLSNLLAIVDVNGQQALGATSQIIHQEPFGERWRHAGWEVREVDGHDRMRLARAFSRSVDGPVVVVARTIFGAGVSFMEGRLDWHYLPMTEPQFELALSEQSGGQYAS